MPTGLQIAMAIRDGRFPGALPPWVERMEVHKENLVRDVDVGRVRSQWTPGRQFTVPDGYVQGGLLCASADGGQALALLTTEKTPRPWATMDLHMRFARPIRMGTAISIESVVVEKTTTSAIVETRFRFTPAKLAAFATGAWRLVEGRRAGPAVLDA